MNSVHNRIPTCYGAEERLGRPIVSGLKQAFAEPH